MGQTIKEIISKGSKVEINKISKDELTRLTTAINDFKYDLGIAPDTDYRNMTKKSDAGRIINCLTKMLFRRELLPESMKKDIKYIIEQLQV